MRQRRNIRYFSSLVGGLMAITTVYYLAMYDIKDDLTIYKRINNMANSVYPDTVPLKADPNELKARTEHMKSRCKQPKAIDFLLKHTALTKTWYLSGRAKLAVCKVPKTGCTLWGLVFIALETQMDVGMAFETNRHSVHDGRYERGVRMINYLKTMPDSLSVVVTRNPYSRLFSAYIDKIYLIGVLNRKFGSSLKKGLYKNKHGETCGFDISFGEFLEEVVRLAQQKGDYDDHWSPVSRMCDPCRMKYDIVVKQESLIADISHVIDNLNISTNKKEDIKEILHAKEQKRTMLSLVRSMLTDHSIHKRDCNNLNVFLEKFWQTLKFQGFIRDTSDFPSKSLLRFNNTFSSEDVTDIIMHEMDSRPLTYSERLSQRKQFLVSAYQNINMSILNQIKRLYKLDFLLFDYSERHPV